MASQKKHQRAVVFGVVSFVIAILVTDWLLLNLALEGIDRTIVAMLPVIALTYWWWQYPSLLAAMDELERAIELEALAKGVGIALWVITTWALLEPHTDIPKMPLFAVAPIIAAFYGIAQTVVSRKYR